MSTTQSHPNKYAFAPCNALQPKRLHTVSTGGDVGGCGLIMPRRILGPKGQLPIPVSHLSNQQLTTLLRNSPLPSSDQGCGSTGGTPECGGGLLTIHSQSGPKRAPNTMAKRNARERNRVKQVNQGFQTLRHHIPESYRMKKMSKVDTLRCALDYIRNMERILQEDDNPEEGSSVPQYHHMQKMPSTNANSSVSPSTSISFSSEEDDYLVAAFSGNFTPSSNTASSPPLDKVEQSEIDLFGTRIIILSSNSSDYNDENNAENNIHPDMKLEGQEERACSNYSHGTIHVLSSNSVDANPTLALGEDQLHSDSEQIEERQEDFKLEIESHGQRLRLLSGSDGHSDMENKYCPEEERLVSRR